ncbi:hypothetical protein GOB15_30150 [Sinorhizobium meliloti]|nr:hypothetical protein [Sinorhizobium meliloti]MDW9515410.1 hypothetical protein [Sinorhizobium meliloti]
MATRLLTILGLLIAASGAKAEAAETIDYLKPGNATWSLFKCAALSGAIDQQEKDRLFKAGYDNGMLFLYGWKSGHVSDVTSLPFQFQVRLNKAMRPAFVMGMVWEAAVNEAFLSNSSAFGSAEWKAKAKALFDQENCGLL